MNWLNGMKKASRYIRNIWSEEICIEQMAFSKDFTHPDQYLSVEYNRWLSLTLAAQEQKSE